MWEFGEGKTAAEGEITLLTSPIESVNIPEPLMSNNTGAETTYLEIVMRKPSGEMSTKRMEQVELRLRYLLDCLWRAERRTNPPTPTVVSSSVDSSIQSDYILCKWDKYMGPINSIEAWVRYCVAYNRNVPVI